MPDYEILEILSDKKVLCLEDEPLILKNICETLKLFFGEVVGVKDGLDALDKALSNYYDVFIFDIVVPKIDGLDIIRQIRKKNIKSPIIIISSYTSQEYLWRAIDLKITKFLQKPYDRGALLKALECASLELTDNNLLLDIAKNLKYDFQKKIVYKNGVASCHLSKNESRLFEYFLNNKNKNFTYDELFDYMWEFGEPSKDAVKTIIKEIRKKTNKDIIKNLYGIGYLYEI